MKTQYIIMSAAFSPGDYAPGVTYPHVKIVKHICQSGTLDFYEECGKWESGSWSPGISAAGITPVHRTLTGSDYDTVMDTTASADEAGHDATERGMYDWLLTNHYSGSLTGTL